MSVTTWMTSLLVLGALGLGGIARAAETATSSGQLPPSDYAKPARLVPIDNGRRLNLFCVGRGEPTVVYLSGLGDNAMVWGFVQGQVGQITRSCSYDRAGLGFSDASPYAGDAVHATLDLEALLSAADIRGKIVLVGHSLGGLYATYYAATHKDQVAGLVLVDPSFPFQATSLFRDVTRAQRHAALEQNVATLRSDRECLRYAEAHRFTLPATDKSAPDVQCLTVGPVPPALQVLVQVRNAQWTAAKFWRALVSESDGIFVDNVARPNADDREIAGLDLHLGARPVAVLTADASDFAPLCQGLNLSTTECASVQRAWVVGHDRLARLSDRGSNVVVAGASHYIQFDAPQLVIDGIVKVVREVR